MNKKQSKRQRDIKTKLMAAVCMLLVSSIMMVSTTYAWFTLSTAPEVTGITTAVGANGNLEMALLPANGSVDTINQNSGVGNSTAEITLRNTTWGNLVDVSSEVYYGLQNITLYPSALETGTGGTDEYGNPTKLAGAAYLATPTYGADGRVAELLANTSTGIYDTTKNQFYPDPDGATQYGVRAVGTASGMTERQLAYRNAKAAGNAAKGLAGTYAAQSLSTNGNALAGIAVKMALTDNPTYTEADLDAMGAIVNDLTKDGGVLDQIETAYIQYLVAFAASGKITEDSVYETVMAAANAEGATLATVMAKVNELLPEGVSLPDGLTAGMTAFNTSVTTVGEAKSLYDTLNDSKESYTWDELKAILEKLANPTKMKVNGYTMDEIQAEGGKQPIIDDVMGGKGITVTVPSGAGIYADVADQSGYYYAEVKVSGIEAMGITINTTAIMDTDPIEPAYLALMETGVTTAGAPASGAVGTNPMSDMFGYIIDMAFRTNAAESELRLQQDAVDRIYKDNTVGGQIEGNEETTMGHGATMTFQSSDVTFGTEKVKGLMDAIRLVFFDPDTKNVYATGKLDTANATVGTDGVTAKIYLYEKTAGGADVYVQQDYVAGVEGVTYYTKGPEVVYTKVENPVAEDIDKYFIKSGEEYVDVTEAFAEGTEYYIQSTQDKYDVAADPASAAPGTLYVKKTSTGEVAVANNKIMNLTQNAAHKLSVLVYLDGNLVGNDDVAVTAAQSMSGKMNLQFCSSATLVPMEYSQLMTSGNASDDSGNSAAPEEGN